jgi:hypothetical protein
VKPEGQLTTAGTVTMAVAMVVVETRSNCVVELVMVLGMVTVFVAAVVI